MGFDTLVTNEGRGKIHDGNGGYWERGYTTELIALETEGSGGIGTLSAANLLPGDAVIEAVVARVTTTIVGVTTWSLGDESVATRFSDAISTLTAGTTTVGLNHTDQTASSPVLGARQSVAGKVVITTDASPSAGVLRVTVYYSRFVAPSA